MKKVKFPSGRGAPLPDRDIWRELALLGISLMNRHPAVEYGDLRLTFETGRMLMVKNGAVDRVSSSVDGGFGIRVLAHGAWGFAASSRWTEEAMARAVRDAVEAARGSARLRSGALRLCGVEPVVAEIEDHVEEDPFAVSFEEMINLLVKTTEIMMEVKGIRVATGNLVFSRHGKLFGSTEGALISQRWHESGGEMSATAVAGDEVQVRSYPNSVGGHHERRGFEFIRNLDFPGHAERVAEEAAALISAEPCPDEETTLVVDSSQMALQLHESCGHAAELDRVLGDEVSLAGGSFLDRGKLNTFEYGSSRVSIVADATLPHALGTFAYDDEGVPGRRFDLVRDGLFTGFLTSRETAAAVGEKQSRGTMRADGWRHIPLIRMTSVSLEPGEGTLDDLISDVRRGVYVETNRSWSIDDLRLNFQFGMELGREIRNGKLGRMFKNPVYAGITPEFWRSCDAVAGPGSWQVWGITNCGKGEPVQAAHVAHGASPARFRKVRVGVKR